MAADANAVCAAAIQHLYGPRLSAWCPTGHDGVRCHWSAECFNTGASFLGSETQEHRSCPPPRQPEAHNTAHRPFNWQPPPDVQPRGQVLQGGHRRAGLPPRGRPRGPADVFRAVRQRHPTGRHAGGTRLPEPFGGALVQCPPGTLTHRVTSGSHIEWGMGGADLDGLFRHPRRPPRATLALQPNGGPNGAPRAERRCAVRA